MRRYGLRSARTVVTAMLLAAVVTASAGGITVYRVRAGDTLGDIAHRYHTTTARLVQLNHLRSGGNMIYAGERLRVPAPPAPRRHSAWRIVDTHYTVRPGDSLYAIAARFHASPHAIAARNHLPRSLVVRIGQRLSIPHRVHSVWWTGVAKSPSRGPHLFSGRAVPPPWRVREIVRQTARRWGVDSRLALAVAWQESGFNQRWVSSTGAVGAMQVEPYTGRFLASYVVHRPLDLYDARDNATAGVALLAVLLRETHGNAKKAVAGYYQGLASVRSRGMFDDTKLYVRSVLALRNRF
jgi:LysM repeat protein